MMYLTDDQGNSIKNTSKTLLESAARTATVSSADQKINNMRGVRVSINTTAKGEGATPSVVPTIEVKDPVSGTYTAVLTGAAITDVGHVEMVVYPGITAAANVAASMAMSNVYRVTMTHADTDSITYSVGVVELI